MMKRRILHCLRQIRTCDYLFICFWKSPPILEDLEISFYTKQWASWGVIISEVSVSTDQLKYFNIYK